MPSANLERVPQYLDCILEPIQTRMQKIAILVHDCIFDIDLEGTILWISDSVKDLTGRTKAEVVNSKIQSCMASESKIEFDKICSQRLLTFKNIRIKSFDKNGNSVHAIILGYPLYKAKHHIGWHVYLSLDRSAYELDCLKSLMDATSKKRMEADTYIKD